MIRMDQIDVSQRPMDLRHAVRDGHDVGLTFRSNLYAAVVPWTKRKQELAELAELAELRARVAELEQQCKEGKA